MEFQRKPGLAWAALLSGFLLFMVAPSAAGDEVLLVHYDCGATSEEAWSGLTLDATGDIFRKQFIRYRVGAVSGGPSEFCQTDSEQMLELAVAMGCLASPPRSESIPGEDRLSLQLVCKGSRNRVVRRVGRVLEHFYGAERSGARRERR